MTTLVTWVCVSPRRDVPSKIYGYYNGQVSALSANSNSFLYRFWSTTSSALRAEHRAANGSRSSFSSCSSHHPRALNGSSCAVTKPYWKGESGKRSVSLVNMAGYRSCLRGSKNSYYTRCALRGSSDGSYATVASQRASVRSSVKSNWHQWHLTDKRG